MNKGELLAALSQAVIRGEVDVVRELAVEASEREMDPLEAIDKALMPGIREVGDRFGREDAYLPELMRSANAMLAGLEILEPIIAAHGQQRQFIGSVLIGTVEGDVHNIGKDIVISVYKANGFDVTDLGVNVPSTVFVEKVTEMKPDILGLSALMTTTLLIQRDVIRMLAEAKIREKVIVLVGGAPVTTQWAEEIGADGTAPDAVSAAKLSTQLLMGRPSA